MLTKDKIDRFYGDVDKLKFKFPVAIISKATGESKGNVSKYLNRVQDPSEQFLEKFYKSFQKEIKAAEPTIKYKDDEDLYRRHEARLIRIEAALEVLGEKIAEREYSTTGAPISQTLTEIENEIKARYRTRLAEDAGK